VITGSTAQWFDPTPVRIAVSSNGTWAAPSAADPRWQRMAARTTSRGEVDQLRRWLNDKGFVDLVHRRGRSSIDSPALGALVFDRPGHLIALENPCPVSVLGLMARCGAVPSELASGPTEFVRLEASSAWWISPSFDVHPVEQIGDARYGVEIDVRPSFLGRLS
jgi:hypothetical protein